jgi:uncharacterized protein
MSSSAAEVSTTTTDARVAASQVRVVLRPMGSPLPLAFAAFGIGSFVFALAQLGVFATTQLSSVTLLLTVFLAPLQLVAALYCFWAREALAATSLSLLSFSWPAVYVVSLNLQPGMTSPVLGSFYLALSAFLLLLAGPGLVGKPLIGSLIVVAASRFLFGGLYELTKSTNMERVAGALGLLITMIGLYGALALGLEDVQHRTILPVGRRGEARTAMDGNLAAQAEPLEHEAGIRRQL